MAARTDNVTDPMLAASLLLMRRGQAYWARRLNELRDDEFDAPSLLPGWSRRHLIAHVGFNARAVARLVEWARTGVETPMYESDTQRAEEIAFGATLPTEALRNLCAHAAVHLNVEWRDLEEKQWSHEVRTAQGRLVPVSETVWMRTREVWIHAVDLSNGASVHDFPAELIDLLLEDLVKVWRRKRADADPDIRLEPNDRDTAYSILGTDDALVVRGSAVDLVGWGIGRATRGVVTDAGIPPLAPSWL
jgi:maleylpyruvate isomerase